MAFLIGTDEAGYGPNLGPLLIAASVWRVPDGRERECLYERLGALITPHPREANRLAIADSKQLYRPPATLHRLQHGVHTAFAALERFPRTWHELWQFAAPTAPPIMAQIPWYQHYPEERLESWTETELRPWVTRWHETLRGCGVELIDLRAVAIFSHELNRGVREAGSKGAVLSAATLDLVADCVRQIGPTDSPIRVVCDKHGGRNRYAGLLQPRFGDRLVQICKEGRESSVYQLGTATQPLEITFRAGGEAFLPSALASMLAKYLREQAMQAFNAFWCSQVADLTPTAGYPVDAARFKLAIAARQRELGIADDLLWRCR